MINLEKSVLHPVKQIEFLGLTIDTKKTTFRCIREKIKACVSTISGDFHATKNFSPKSHKVNWPAAISCPNLFASRNLVSISSIKTNISSTEKGILKWSCDTEEFIQGRTLLVDEKLETLQWEENPATGTPYENSDRCLDKMTGAYCKDVSAKWKWS